MLVPHVEEEFLLEQIREQEGFREDDYIPDAVLEEDWENEGEFCDE